MSIINELKELGLWNSVCRHNINTATHYVCDIVCKATVTGMTTVRNFEVMFDIFKI